MARLRGHSGLTDRGLVRGASAPSGAAIGQMWFNTGTGVLYQRTANVDGSSFWLDISSGGIGTSAERGVDFVGDVDPHKATNGTGLAVGSVYYNREKNRHFVCTNATPGSNVWSGRYNGVGGTVTDYESSGTFYKVHTFLSDDTFIMEDATSCDILILGGGGAGGFGGGGAGAFRAWTGMSFPTGSFTMTIGAGGGSGPLSGGNTTVVQASGTGFSTITAQGGGHGGRSGTQPAENGGSGGGGKATGNGGPNAAGTGNTGSDTAAINSGTVVSPAVSGYAGGAGIGTDHLGSGGGGGASAVGAAGQSGTVTGGSGPGGNGGGSRNNNFRTGSNIAYAGGGGGAGIATGGTTNDSGDSGGGGSTAGDYGGPASGEPANATANSGSGGGGGSVEGGYGGSGIIVIRYALS